MIDVPSFQDNKLRHFLAIEGLPDHVLVDLIHSAQTIIQHQQHIFQQRNDLANKTLANLFYEASTRTRCSFELAAKRMGAEVVNFHTKQSSILKGETLLDTFYTFQAMACQLIVVRHRETGIPAWLAHHAEPGVSVINAGDGANEHPSQAMLDMLTIAQHKTDFKSLKVSIIGDIRHSRVARSQLHALNILQVADIRVIAPSQFLPEDIYRFNVAVYDDMVAGITDSDVIIMLRIQHERMEKTFTDLHTYHQAFGLTKDKLRYAKPDAIIMHPGPMNRGVEISNDVADCSQAVIQEQVKNGIAMRMAIMQMLCTYH
ncbi:MAG: aspartate carbamoyltransferase catalytic subunit [Gammaproteobacteria bacterium]